MRSREWLVALMASGLLAAACSAAEGGGHCLDANGYPLNPQPDLPGCQFSSPGAGGSPANSGGSAPVGAAGAISGTGTGGATANIGGGAGAPSAAAGASATSGGTGGALGIGEGGEGGFGGEGPLIEAGAGGEGGAVVHH